MTLYSGRSLVFVGEALFSAAQIDALIDATGAGKKLPMPTSTPAYDWKRVGFLDSVTLNIARKVDKLKSQGFGVLKIVAGEDEGPDLAFDLVDTSVFNLLNLLLLNPDETDDTKHFTRIKSIEGADLTAKGKPILVYRAEFDPTNKSDIPKIGTGGDTAGFILFNATTMENIQIPYKGPELAVPTKLGAVAVDGTVDDNKGLYGCRLDLSQLVAA